MPLQFDTPSKTAYLEKQLVSPGFHKSDAVSRPQSSQRGDRANLFDIETHLLLSHLVAPLGKDIGLRP